MFCIAPLERMFRPATSHTYPPFKYGRYMEEYAYDVLSSMATPIPPTGIAEGTWVYLPAFWTNLQNHPGFQEQRAKYQWMLDRVIRSLPSHVRYFTVVQHDDGVAFTLPVGTRVYGACTGHIRLPLIYEDTRLTLLHTPRVDYPAKDIFLSFVGTTGTHPVRRLLRNALEGKRGVEWHSRDVWSPSVRGEDANQFVATTLRSRFCLSPRGYGRSSFRFFEAMLLETVPVYVWDDEEWLPYQEVLDYSAFSVSIRASEVDGLYDRLQAITEEQYQGMIEEIRRVRSWFSLDGMCRYLLSSLS